jgi:uncharacterized membrane protein YkoI
VTRFLISFGAFSCIAVCLGLTAGCASLFGGPEPPRAVTDAIGKACPGATVDEVELDDEEGASVWEAEVRENGTKKTISLTADGTVREIETRLEAADLPEPVRAALEAAAPGAKVRKAEKSEVFVDAAGAKLARPEVKYEIRFARECKKAEITIDAAGKVVEAPKSEECD